MSRAYSVISFRHPFLVLPSHFSIDCLLPIIHLNLLVIVMKCLNPRSYSFLQSADILHENLLSQKLYNKNAVDGV